MVASASVQASAAATARRSAKGVKTRSPSAGAPTRCKMPSASPCASIGTHIALLRSPSTVCRQANSVPDALTWWTRPHRSAQQSAGGKLLATGRSPQLVTSSTTSRDAPYKYTRSEEHTSELQSLTNLVCRLLLEKKKETEREGRMR